MLPEALAPLGELVDNLRWSWHPPTQEVFAAVDPSLWETVRRDPVRLLGEVPPERLQALASDQAFLNKIRSAHQDLQRYLTEDRWYQHADSDAPRTIAYFSPEFGITHVLPQYSGGLGVLAGDHLKAASDLGVPIVGVGLLYRHGYFVQSLSREGWQQERYPLVDPNNLPLNPLRDADGSPVRVYVNLPGDGRLAAAVWLAQVGRVPLLMLDSDVEENGQAEREVTDRLYGGGGEHRLQQEMLLGIGGVRALRIYSRVTGTPAPEVFHTNEGHAGFLGLERIRELTEEHGLSLDSALEAARSGTVFTTHTPVPAGIDRFPRDLMQQYFGGDNASPGLPVERILALGAEDYPGGDPEVFNMAVMGLRLAQRANGVSRLHGQVSREMFAGLWPAFDQNEIPIAAVTNGVHAPTWVAPEVMRLARRAGGTDLVERGEGWEQAAAKVRDADIWSTKRVLRERLVQEARRRLRESARQRGASEAELGWIDGVLDPDVLTIGFARRVPSYKRLTLMLRDRDRLRAILLHPQRPAQIVIAGKAHPADDGGKRLIQEMVRFTDEADVRHRIVFLPDYDIALAQPLYPGCDVWLNNPLRPYEACGTSGMKAALNGALNLSIRDGWWDEWFGPEFGWAIPSAEGVEDAEHRDDLEAAALVRHHRAAGDTALLRRRRRWRAPPVAGDAPPDADLAWPEGAGHPDDPRLRRAVVPAGGPVVPRTERRLRRRQGARLVEGTGTGGVVWRHDRARGEFLGRRCVRDGAVSAAPGLRVARLAFTRRRGCPGRVRAGGRVRPVEGAAGQLAGGGGQVRKRPLPLRRRREPAAHRPVRLHRSGGAPPRPVGRCHRARPGGSSRGRSYPSWLMLGPLLSLQPQQTVEHQRASGSPAW